LQKKIYGAMQKLFIKKELEKMDKCLRYLKQWVLRCPPKKKKEMNKIAPILLQMFLSFKKRDKFSRSKVELGLATIYPHTYIS
jgi:hypothetical protein